MNDYYRLRVNAVMDYIDAHLDEELGLETLAGVANFSKYHFHRIWKGVVGETLNRYVNRIRLEKARRRIVSRPDLTITDVAYSLGFSSSANFARDFSARFGEPPSSGKGARRGGIGGRVLESPIYLGIETLEPIPVIYARVDTGYDTGKIAAAFGSLYAFALGEGLARRESRSIGIGYDDPEYTPPDRCRYDACLEVPAGYEPGPGRPFNLKAIAGGAYATFGYSGRAEGFAGAWDSIFRDWAVEGDAVLDDRPHIELYLPSERYLEGLYETRLCLPVLLPPIEK
ncbi:MAG: AraC family transcriptional regulator [Spirochaetes bacterium]|nr:AraC family transcriptional regulator [Spirochaetota bacterium]MBU1080802.1 AraC family transcriptional regulator [Spirochaetota bacterium]